MSVSRLVECSSSACCSAAAPPRSPRGRWRPRRATAPGEAAAAPGQLAVAHRETIDVPGGLSQELTSATILLDLVVDAQGEVTSVRPVSFAMRNDATGMSVSVTDLKTVEAMLRRDHGQA